MLSNNLAIKLILTPLIIAAATLVSRRWGEKIGGLMIGLPLTSGPVSVFFAMEQGKHFAENAAKGSILGLIPVAFFCIGYIRGSRRMPWYLASAIGISLYFITVIAISNYSPELGLELVLVPSVLALALMTLGDAPAFVSRISPPWWDLTLRMLFATTLLVVITGSASSLGPEWGGLLSPFPVFTFVMAAFSHKQGGPGVAWRLIRGVLIGLFAYTAFFIAVAMLVERVDLLVVYFVASCAALAVEGVSLAVLIWKERASQPDQAVVRS